MPMMLDWVGLRGGIGKKERKKERKSKKQKKLFLAASCDAMWCDSFRLLVSWEVVSFRFFILLEFEFEKEHVEDVDEENKNSIRALSCD